MLNLFAKKAPWLAASILAAASVFGQSREVNANDPCRAKPACAPKPVCPPKPCCDPVPQIQLIPAYNAPARVDVRGCWDLYFGASFIYWEAMQDNMSFATSGASNQASGVYSTTPGTKSTSVIIGQDFEYKPGFKVLAGMNFDQDNWDGYAEYTWFRSSVSASVAIPPVDKIPAGTSVGISPTMGSPDIVSIAGVYDSGSQDWFLKFQALDTALARTYYVGTKLTFRSIFGARFAWFTQEKEATFVANVVPNVGTKGTWDLDQRFSSWGAGILAGLHTNWILGEGFRIIGNGSVDLLYTRVQTTNDKEIWAPVGAATVTRAYRQPRPDFVMPHMDLEFGFGWSTYFDCNNWHIDLLATYGFQAFWGAELFRHFDDDVQVTNSNLESGNLYLHGLTVSARLDF